MLLHTDHIQKLCWLTVGVTCAGADGGTPSKEKPAEAEKLPEKRADSPASSARFVSQQTLTEPALNQEKCLDAWLEALRASFHNIDTFLNYMSHGQQTDTTYCSEKPKQLTGSFHQPTSKTRWIRKTTRTQNQK
jgi:hypothetical protein